MPDKDSPSAADVSELNEQLQGGIETCRSVIANYRSLLSEQVEAAGDRGDSETADERFCTRL